MDIKTLILLISPMLFSVNWSCIPADSGTTGPNVRKSSGCPEGSKLNADGTDCVKSGEEGDPFGDGDPFGNLDDEEDLIPNYDTATLDSRFNRRNIATLNIPEEYEEAAIIANRSEFYRRIWWDLRGGAWNVSPTGSSSQVANISTHQPLQGTSLLPFDDEPLQFYLGGHTYVPALANPCKGTLIMTPSPYIEANQAAIAPPLDYEEIYTRIGRTSEDELNQCIEEFEKLQKNPTALPAVEKQEKCDVLFQGLLMTTYNQHSGTFNNGFDELIQKESVAIWRPKPQEGYKCLGDITTNGKNNKPFTERDHAQSVVDVPVSERYAMYCVKEEFVVRGKIDINSMITDGEGAIFRIINDFENEPDGLADGNFFYTIRGSVPTSQEALKTLAENTEVWVLNKKTAIFEEDDKRLEKDDLCK